ncbi:hypothetical protein KKF91_07115 [Myxococcota bacterium]|nr:hypothetical protein [Myxococcota bacterium]MBU1430322.1 hypothetical protein [Myxococcota bacterium]MBU1900594.1 hypothetical protein [Myxococcota bacterium]
MMKAVIEDEFSDLIKDRYELYGEIGSGTFGVAYKAKQKSTGQIVAIKRLLAPQKDNVDQIHQQNLRYSKEISLLGSLKGDYVVSLIDVGYT